MDKELLEKVKQRITSLLRDMIEDCKESYRYEYDCEAGWSELCMIRGYLFALLDAGHITKEQGDTISQAVAKFQDTVCTGYTNHGTKQKKALMKLIEEL